MTLVRNKSFKQKKLLLWISCVGIHSSLISCSEHEKDASSEQRPLSLEQKVGKQDCQDWSELATANLPALPKTPYTESFEQVWRIVLEKHFDPTLNCQDWPSLRVKLGRELVKAESPADAYRLINDLLMTLGQSHFRVFGPEPENDSVDGEARLPIHLRWIDEQVIVAKPMFTQDPSVIPEGSVLLTIGEHSMETLIQQLHHQIPASENNFAFEAARLLERYTHCPEHYVHTLSYLDPQQQDKKVSKKVTCVLPPGEKMSLGYLQDVPTHIHWHMIPDSKIGYLAFNLWMLPLIKKVETAVHELRAQGMEALMIDLRGNPGGVGAMTIPVARMFLTDSASLGTLQFRNFRQELNVVGNPQAFTGPIFVFVDEGTASTSEIFVAGMRDLQRIQVYGTSKTAGAALPSLLEKLKDGALFQYVVGDYQSSKGTRVEGQGIRPDVLVQETREDLINKRDPVVDAAVQALKSHMKEK